MDLYRTYPWDLMSLMQHVIETSTLLVVMRARRHHAATHPSDEVGHDGDDHDDEGDDHNHDHEDGDDDASSGASPSDHGRHGISDPCGSTPTH